ncbi:MAG: YchJ family protein [Pyramidobacter sp.]|nr:YchJ family protein [Pyramidobacter sp.]
MSLCPCGSGREFESCCKPIIDGVRKAATAEDLMRARYTAYTTGAIDFIMSSHDPETRETVSEDATRKWSQSARWLGLDIRKTVEGGVKDTKGLVEFVAKFEIEGKEVDHHEKAVFRKQKDEWYFVDGQIVTETYVRPTPKIGRNDPCPCGSGKKYKFCCGKNK